MNTLMAKELMLGIKDSVEDVSAMFKLHGKSQTSGRRMVYFRGGPHRPG